MKLPWYIKKTYNAEKRCYILKVNKWWELWKYIQIHLFLRWIRKNTYLFTWKQLNSDITIKDTPGYWKTPTQEDCEKLNKMI